MQIGHAGAIVERGRGAREKEAALAAVGVKIATRYDQLAELVALPSSVRTYGMANIHQ